MRDPERKNVGVIVVDVEKSVFEMMERRELNRKSEDGETSAVLGTDKMTIEQRRA